MKENEYCLQRYFLGSLITFFSRLFLYSKVMDQGQSHACGLDVAICCDRMMQTYQKIPICQRKSIKFKPLSCLSQTSDTKLTFVFVMTIHFGQMKKLLVWVLWLRG